MFTKLRHYTTIGFALILVVGLMACQPETPASNANPSTPDQTTASQPSQETERVVLAEGQVVPLEYNNLSFQTGGRVANILVEEGDEVAAGDPLIQLEPRDFELTLAQAEARLASAQGGVMAASAAQASAEARLTTAELAVTSAEAQLALVQAGPRPEQVEAAEKSLAAAQAGVGQAAGSRDAALNISNAQIEAARAQVAAAQADYQAIQDGYDTIIDTCFTDQDGNEICPLLGPTEENARFQLQAANLNLQAAQAGLDQLLAGPTAAQRSAAGGAVSVAIANREGAEAQLALILAGATPEQIRQAEVGVDQARLGIAQAEAAVTQAQAAVTQAQAVVTTAEAGVAAAQAALDRLTLTAVFDGTVARIDIGVGEIASPAVPVVTVADFSAWLVETTDLTELDVANVTEGANVTIELDAIPNETLNGTVTQVATVASLSQGDIVYAVEIELAPAPNLPIRWGMTAFVTVE